ncbi:MAG: acyl-CoA dehydrogenase family protein [Planctomycetota bacterium]
MTYDFRSAAREVALVCSEHALRVDQEAVFPRATVDAAKKAGLLGLLSSTEVGGKGGSLRDAAEVVETLAAACGSSAMVITMHYAGTAVVEAFGDRGSREAIARGEHLTTLAFSEAGSRSHFWAPVSSARNDGGEVLLDANKSWVTSANAAHSFVWSSRPVAAEGLSTLWLVPNHVSGLRATATYEGLGLRGNDSAPVSANAVRIPAARRLGDDGAGFGVMMQTVLPAFSVMIAAGSLGLMRAALEKSAAHAAGTNYQHLPSDAALANLPTIRAYLARMQIDFDSARALWLDTLTALETGRADAMLRVLEVKAACAEAALRVVDSAMRVCGGMAYRKEVGVERHFRDARAAMVMAPTSDQAYDFLGKLVTGLPLF